MKSDPGRQAREGIGELYRRCFGAAPALRGWAPGRINLIGEHTDHQHGWALPTPTPLGVHVAAGPGEEGLLRAVSREQEGIEAIELSAPGPRGGWADLLGGLLLALTEDSGPPPGKGVDVAIAGDLPLGAGLSSSAALSVAAIPLIMRLLWRDRPPVPPSGLPQIARRGEALGLGVPCGILDPYVAVHGREGQALLLDCGRGRHRTVPLGLDGVEPPLRLAVIDSGARRRLADGRYGRLLELCSAAARALGRPLRGLPPEDLDGRREELSAAQYRHALHVIEESRRTREAAAALEEGNFRRFGELLGASHRSLKENLRATCPATDAIVDALEEVDGVLGARQVGGGWGGAVLLLGTGDGVDEAQARAQTAGGEGTRPVLLLTI
ncbi:MAG: galactokinase [Planctomycetota bacterium]